MQKSVIKSYAGKRINKNIVTMFDYAILSLLIGFFLICVPSYFIITSTASVKAKPNFSFASIQQRIERKIKIHYKPVPYKVEKSFSEMIASTDAKLLEESKIEERMLESVIANVVEQPKPQPVVYVQHEGALTKSRGTINGPSGKETWYNLDMSGVINIMRKAGYSEEEYPYWIRDDGCKMLGQYIMVGGDIINTRKRGDIVETSLGIGIVCDHCANAQYNNPTLLDIAVNW